MGMDLGTIPLWDAAVEKPFCWLNYFQWLRSSRSRQCGTESVSYTCGFRPGFYGSYELLQKQPLEWENVT